MGLRVARDKLGLCIWDLTRVLFGTLRPGWLAWTCVARDNFRLAHWDLTRVLFGNFVVGASDLEGSHGTCVGNLRGAERRFRGAWGLELATGGRAGWESAD